MLSSSKPHHQASVDGLKDDIYGKHQNHACDSPKCSVTFIFPLLLIWTTGILYYERLPGELPLKGKYDTMENFEEDVDGLMELEVIVTFPVLTEPNFNSSSFAKYSHLQKIQRMTEYVTSLQRTLSHRLISHVHLLYDQPQMPRYIREHVRPTLVKKLSLHYLRHTRNARTSFQFAFSHLRGHLVMITQADVYPGYGLDLIKKQIMKKNKLMYALTRHAQLEKGCDMRKHKKSNTCSAKRYIGSHDAYVFVPMGKLPKNVLNKPSNHVGIDNLIVWTFGSVLQYRVLNPCLVIYTYHLHCSGVRNSDRLKRVNTRKTNGRAVPTHKLV